MFLNYLFDSVLFAFVMLILHRGGRRCLKVRYRENRCISVKGSGCTTKVLKYSVSNVLGEQKQSHVKVSLTIEHVDCGKFSWIIMLLYLIRSKLGFKIHSENVCLK